MSKTKFASSFKIVPVSANPAAKEGEPQPQQQGLKELIDTVLAMVDIPDRDKGSTKDFQFSIDHCFQIKGQGTVITGTVLAGKAKVGDVVELPALKQEKKIKSMQIFRKPVQSCKQGDRVGICLAQLDSSLIERGIAAKPGSLKPTDCVILIVRRIPYFAGEIKSKSKLHLSIGHQTMIG